MNALWRIVGARGVIALAIAALALWFWLGWSSAAADRDDARDALSKANAELALLRTDATLKEVAAGERQVDTAIVAQAEKELLDAIKEVPDSQPDAVRVHLGCERLLRAGWAEADLPEPCRFDGRAETRAPR